MPRPAFALLLVASLACVLHAQSTNASLTGRITDPSKALIADAKVAAISAETNARYGTTSNASGEYYLAYLPPGSYRIEIEKPGFKKLVKPDVILHVQDVLAIDFELAVGSASESITVEGGAPLVNTESAALSTVVDRAFVENIPMNGRSFQTLIALTPGVVVTPTAFDDQGQFSVNGQRADANYFTIDGVSANFGVTGYIAMVQSASGALPALTALGGTNSLVSVEDLQEFRIQTASFAPEFGRTPGGQISILTRSGTNAFHGTLFEYFRNDVLDARDWFVNFNHLAKPAERQNDFGGVFGGPILKDKTFFFFSYEGLRLRQPSAEETIVPDAASRQAAPILLRPYLNVFPVANGAELGSGLAQFNAGFSDPSTLNAYSIRVDHVVSSKVTLFGRYDYSPSTVDLRGPQFPSGPVLSSTNSLSSSVQTFTVGLTELITPRISNEVRANYSNDRIGNTYGLDSFGGAVPLPDSVAFPSGFTSKNSIFQFVIGGAGEYSLGNLGANEQRQVNLVDNLSVTRSSHQLKFGVDYRWLAPFSGISFYHQFADFSGMTAAPGGVLSGTAVFADADAFQATALLSQNFSFYGQDAWKIGTRLTLTYGLRWDINPAIKGKNSANEPFTVIGLNDPATMTLAPRGTPLYPTTYGNVAPRLGLAYQLRRRPNWDSVLRAGFGVFYDIGQGSLGGVSSYFPYFAAKNFFFPAPFPLTEPSPLAITTNPPVQEIVIADPHVKVPRTYQWNVSVEQSLGSSQSLSVTYIGAIGRKLLRATNLFNPNKNFQFVSLTNNTATSDYHALQLKFERRLSHGLQVLSAYTFSHSIDIASTDAFANYLNTPGGGAYQNQDRGDSDFDIWHAFTAGVTYNLPVPGAKKALRTAFGGWSLDTFAVARSAPPVDIIGAISPGYGTELASRPNVIAGVPQVLYGSQYPGGKAFNNTIIPAACPGPLHQDQVGAWCPAPAGKQGDFGRNVLRGFGAWQADFAVQRQFRLTEATGLRFRAEFFNIFNHPNFGGPDNTITDGHFGQSTQTLANSLGSGGTNGGFSPLYQIGGPRSIQLALKLQF